MSNPTDQEQEKQEQKAEQVVPLPVRQSHLSRAGIFSLLVVIGMLLVLITGLLIANPSELSPQTTLTPTNTTSPASPTGTHAPTPTPTLAANVTPTPEPPIFTANSGAIPSLQLPTGHYVLYEQQNNIYMISSDGGLPQVIPTQGYTYSQAVRPLLTQTGQLLYAGDGVWITDVFHGTPKQIASIDPGQVITSLALSNDGTTVAWSVEPANGKGNIELFAGPLDSPSLVYQQSADNCPCFRVFSFLSGSGKSGDTTLLLTDDQGSLEAVQYGLWAFDLTEKPVDAPQQLMPGDPLQGPLLMAPYSNVMLYSSNEGTVPIPTDESVPTDIASLTYANSLDVASIDSHSLTLGPSQVVLPEQRDLRTTADYYWVTTPVFSPDGHTLVYVEFSSDPQAPFDRNSAIYVAQISGSGAHLRVSSPKLLVTSTALLLELGPWFNSHILTFYGDGTLYAMDIQTKAVTTIAQTNAYARMIAVIGLNKV